MDSDRTEPNRPRVVLRPLVRAAGIGTAMALVLTLALYGLSRLADDQLIVTAPGQATGPVPLAAVAGATAVAGLLALVLAVLVSRLARPRSWYAWITAAGLLLSFSSPLGAAGTTATVLWLCAMHIAVAVALVPQVLRALPSGAVPSGAVPSDAVHAGAVPSSAPVFAGQVAVVAGGTDGIGAATALRLRELGADVVILGRSQGKADALVARAAAITGPGSLRAVVADFSRMDDVRRAVAGLAETITAIDILVQTVGILISRTEHTDEGIEKDFAVSYLSRFVFLETAAGLGLLHPGTRLVNVAASSPKVPRYAQLDVTDLATVESRTGMRSHGQAQLANDLLSAAAGARYGIVAIGYGPGSVRTSIRREIPAAVQALMAPFFYLSTRDPEDVADQLAGILGTPGLVAGRSYFYGRKGQFAAAAFVADPARQQGLIDVSTTLAGRTAIKGA